MHLDLDMPVSCSDGPFGELEDVVIDPLARTLTHLVVRPTNRAERARLLAIEGADRQDGSEVLSLDCTAAEARALVPVQEAVYVLAGEMITGGPDWDPGIQDLFGVAESGTLGPEILGAGMSMTYDQHVGVSYHRIPKGTVEVRRTSSVTSKDGHHLGHVAGFVIDDDGRVIDLVLEHGHLWGRHTVLIPAPAVDRFETDELMLMLNADEVETLEPVTHHWWG